MNDAIEGRAWVFGDSVDTDNMYPGFAMKLPLQEAAKHVFYDLRPGWTDEVADGDVVVAGRNFGIGSSRPVAQLFLQLGVAALVAEEFNSLFLRNSINFGLPAVTIPGAAKAIADGSTVRLDIQRATIEAADRRRMSSRAAAARVRARHPRPGRAPAQAGGRRVPARRRRMTTPMSSLRTWSLVGTPAASVAVRARRSLPGTGPAWLGPRRSRSRALPSPTGPNARELSRQGRRAKHLSAAGLARPSCRDGRARSDRRGPRRPPPKALRTSRARRHPPRIGRFRGGRTQRGWPARQRPRLLQSEGLRRPAPRARAWAASLCVPALRPLAPPRPSTRCQAQCDPRGHERDGSRTRPTQRNVRALGSMRRGVALLLS